MMAFLTRALHTRRRVSLHALAFDCPGNTPFAVTAALTHH